jgi:hypothetical protein
MQFHKASLYKISNCFDYDMVTFMAQMLDNLCALADKVITLLPQHGAFMRYM